MLSYVPYQIRNACLILPKEILLSQLIFTVLRPWNRNPSVAGDTVKVNKTHAGYGDWILN